VSTLLQQIKEFEENEPLTREELTKAIGAIISKLAETKDHKVHDRLAKHADLVREVTRLFANDKFWHKEMEANKAMAKLFRLDPLIQSNNPTVRKIGYTMGAVLMTRVTSIDLVDIVDTDFAMEKINQCLCKYIINQHYKLREHFDDQFDEVHDRLSDFQKKLNRDINKINEALEARLKSTPGTPKPDFTPTRKNSSRH
jgi:hypothetical protein